MIPDATSGLPHSSSDAPGGPVWMQTQVQRFTCRKGRDRGQRQEDGEVEKRIE